MEKVRRINIAEFSRIWEGLKGKSTWEDRFSKAGPVGLGGFVGSTSSCNKFLLFDTWFSWATVVGFQSGSQAFNLTGRRSKCGFLVVMNVLKYYEELLTSLKANKE